MKKKLIKYPFLTQDVEVYTLENGHTIVLAHKEGGLVNISSWVKTGSINENSKKVVPFDLQWKQNGPIKTSLLAPAVYYVEYQTCQDEYKATINYYYYQNGNKTKEKVEFDDKNVENPYIKKSLLAGESFTKDSPELKGCEIVDTNGKKYDADKTVKITIDKDNPKDVIKDVYYYCKALDEGKENSTGDSLIYIVWAIGLGAIGYTVYYLKKYRNEEI